MMDRKVLKFTLKNICMVDGCEGKADSSTHLCEDHRGIRIESDPPRTEQVPVTKTNTRGPLFNTLNSESHKRLHDQVSGPTNPGKKRKLSEPAAIGPLFEISRTLRTANVTATRISGTNRQEQNSSQRSRPLDPL